MRQIRWMGIAAGLLASVYGMAQAPSGAPAGATGRCKDGTFSTAATKLEACHGHFGVRDWYVAPVTAPVEGQPAVATAVPAAVVAPSPSPTSTVATDVPAGGAPGLVWVNTTTKVYHCAGSQFYGRTKGGKFMPEADAKAMGGRPAHGIACSK
ncbi:DUF3761 domain-containing protein [Granulicella sp. dw_53]|uniref:DUF3761 domain-containing protein n=1 Tax=Granulicella sp. dw_53 TaxID=2719792 RepID=UPI001BD5141D|nr:DUF3761 domain-containing protein [Granulicella sp. dw_53]